MMQDPLVDNYAAFDKENVWYHQIQDVGKLNLYMKSLSHHDRLR